MLIDNNASWIRFFGKIYGEKGDYYILQGTLKEYVDGSNSKPNMEKRGYEGVNRYVFWVANYRN